MEKKQAILLGGAVAISIILIAIVFLMQTSKMQDTETTDSGTNPPQQETPTPPTQQSTPTNQPTPTPDNPTGDERAAKANEDYTVQAITDTIITLRVPEGGTMDLPNDESVVTVFAGPSNQSSPEIPIRELKVGQRVDLYLVPGEYAWIYILD